MCNPTAKYPVKNNHPLDRYRHETLTPNTQLSVDKLQKQSTNHSQQRKLNKKCCLHDTMVYMTTDTKLRDWRPSHQYRFHFLSYPWGCTQQSSRLHAVCWRSTFQNPDHDHPNCVTDSKAVLAVRQVFQCKATIHAYSVQSAVQSINKTSIKLWQNAQYTE